MILLARLYLVVYLRWILLPGIYYCYCCYSFYVAVITFFFHAVALDIAGENVRSCLSYMFCANFWHSDKVDFICSRECTKRERGKGEVRRERERE